MSSGIFCLLFSFYFFLLIYSNECISYVYKCLTVILGGVNLVCVFPAGVWVVVRTSFPMQSSGSGAPVTETSVVYCPALITASGTADDDVKTLAVTSRERHIQAYPTSHLVTNRSYTASKLTSDYVSERSEKPSEIPSGTIPHTKSELKIHIGHGVGHSATSQRKDITNVDNNRAEYVTFIRSSSDSSTHSESTSETVNTYQSPLLGRNQTRHRVVTSVKNDAVYSEFKDDNDDDDDDDDDKYTDVVTPSSSAAAWNEIVDERDKLLQRVSRLTTEKQEMVYKLRDFVETNGQLHHAIAELQNQLHKVESILEHEQHEKALLNVRLIELTSNEHCVNREELSSDSRQQMLQGAEVKTGDDSFFYSRYVLIKFSLKFY